MNWTSRTPVENMKCIVETSTGSTFPACYSNGVWWNYSRNFPVEGVTRWIVYPEGEAPNDYIAPEVLLKYVARNFKEMEEIAKGESAKVRELIEKMQRLKEKQENGNSERIEKLLKEVEQLKEELKLVRKQARKGRTLQNNLRKLLDSSALLDAPEENQTDEQIVA